MRGPARKYQFSKEAAIRSATFIVEKTVTFHQNPKIPIRYWQLNYGILTATIALFVYFCHVGPAEEAEAQHSLLMGLDALRKTDRGSAALATTAETVKGLYGEFARQARKVRLGRADCEVQRKNVANEIVTPIKATRLLGDDARSDRI